MGGKTVFIIAVLRLEQMVETKEIFHTSSESFPTQECRIVPLLILEKTSCAHCPLLSSLFEKALKASSNGLAWERLKFLLCRLE